MIINVLWAGMIAAGATSFVFMVAWAWFHSPERTVDEVVDYLHPIDLEKVHSLLDPALEWSLRRNLGPHEFRSTQRKRMHLYIEFLRRMAHNAGIMVEYGNQEAEHTNEEAAKLARALQQEALHVRIYALASSLKVRFWLLLNSLSLVPAPSLPSLRSICGIEGWENYGRLKSAAATLFIVLKNDRCGELLQNL
jgi:hypothetical protein